jgi:hypothetical protein
MIGKRISRVVNASFKKQRRHSIATATVLKVAALPLLASTVMQFAVIVMVAQLRPLNTSLYTVAYLGGAVVRPPPFGLTVIFLAN